MPILFGRQWTPEQLRQLTGHMNQLAGIRPITHDDGRSTGLRAFQVWTGSGLAFDVLADRCLDVGPCTFNGMSVTWNSPAGFADPAYFEPEGLRWLRTFGGGLFATWGYRFASPLAEFGEEFGLHGRAGNLQAEQVGYRTYWDGDDYRLEITGQVRQARLFGENLVFGGITTGLGSSAIHIQDVVTNEGWDRQPHMMMYHFNLGFPVISPSTELEFPKRRVIPRTPLSEQHIGEHMQLQPPTPGFSEHVFIMKSSRPWTARDRPCHQSRGGDRREPALPRGHPALPGAVEDDGPGRVRPGRGAGQQQAMEGRAEPCAKGVLVELEPGGEQALRDHVRRRRDLRTGRKTHHKDTKK